MDYLEDSLTNENIILKEQEILVGHYIRFDMKFLEKAFTHDEQNLIAFKEIFNA